MNLSIFNTPQFPLVLYQVNLAGIVHIWPLKCSILWNDSIIVTSIPLYWLVLHGFFGGVMSTIYSCFGVVHRVWLIFINSIIIVLIFHNHVVKNDARHHDGFKRLYIKHSGSTPNNSLASLEYTKTTLHIIPASFLTTCKVFFLCTLWTWHCFDK